MKDKRKRKNTRNSIDATPAQQKALAKKLTPGQIETAKRNLTDGVKTAFSSADVMDRLWEEYRPLLETGDVSRLKESNDCTDAFREALTVHGLDNHVPLVESVTEEYRPLAVSFSEKLIKDYNCQSAGEKALAETVVGAFIRILFVSRRLNSVFAPNSISISRESTTYYSILSKELDRANRHFTTALQTLIQIKQPSLNINLKSDNAYLAQAQQFNMDKPEPKEDEKIVSPK